MGKVDIQKVAPIDTTSLLVNRCLEGILTKKNNFKLIDWETTKMIQQSKFKISKRCNNCHLVKVILFLFFREIKKSTLTTGFSGIKLKEIGIRFFQYSELLSRCYFHIFKSKNFIPFKTNSYQGVPDLITGFPGLLFLYIFYPVYTCLNIERKFGKRKIFNFQLNFSIFHYYENFDFIFSPQIKIDFIKKFSNENRFSIFNNDLIFFRNLTIIFNWIGLKLNIKRLFGLRLWQTFWEIISKKNQFLFYNNWKDNKLCKRTENILKERKFQKTPFSKRLFRVIIQKTSDFLRDYFSPIKKIFLEIFSFLETRGKKASNIRSFFYRNLSFRFDNSNFLQKKNLIEFYLKARIQSVKLSQTPCTHMNAVSEFPFFKKNQTKIWNRLSGYNNQIKFNGGQFSKIKQKEKKRPKKNKEEVIFSKNFFRRLSARSFFEEINKEKYMKPQKNKLSSKMLSISLQLLKRNLCSVNYQKQNLEVFLNLICFKKKKIALSIIQTWVSFLSNASRFEVALINSYFLKTILRKINILVISGVIKIKIQEYPNFSKTVQIRCLFWVLKELSVFSLAKKKFLCKKMLEFVKKFLLRDKMISFLWLKIFFQKNNYMMKSQKKISKISPNHGVFLIFSKTFWNYFKKGQMNFVEIRESLFIYTSVISFDSIKFFNKLVKKLKKKTILWRKKKNRAYDHVLFFFNALIFSKTTIIDRKTTYFNTFLSKDLKTSLVASNKSELNYNIYQNLVLYENFFIRNYNNFDFFIEFLAEAAMKKNRWFKFIFLRSMVRIILFKKELFKKYFLYIAFFLITEKEKETRQEAENFFAQIYLINSMEKQEKNLEVTQNISDESSFILKKKFFLLFKLLKNKTIKLKKCFLKNVIVSQKKNFLVTFIKRKFFEICVSKKKKKKDTYFFDLFGLIIGQKSLKEESYFEFFKKISESSLNTSRWNVLNKWIRQFKSVQGERRMAIFLALLVYLKKPLPIKKMANLNLSTKNRRFFTDKIIVLLRGYFFQKTL